MQGREEWPEVEVGGVWLISHVTHHREALSSMVRTVMMLIILMGIQSAWGRTCRSWIELFKGSWHTWYCTQLSHTTLHKNEDIFTAAAPSYHTLHYTKMKTFLQNQYLRHGILEAWNQHLRHGSILEAWAMESILETWNTWGMESTLEAWPSPSPSLKYSMIISMAHASSIDPCLKYWFHASSFDPCLEY